MAGHEVIIVNGEEAIREVLVKNSDNFSDRPQMFRMKAINGFHDGLSFASVSPKWKAMKKTMMTCIKLYGDETMALESTQDFIRRVEAHNGKPFDPDASIHRLVTEITFLLVASEKPSEQQLDSIKDLVDSIALLLAPLGPGQELEVLPALRYCFNPTWKKIQGVAKRRWELFDGIVQARKKVVDLQNPRCLTDALFRHQKKENKYSTGEHTIDEHDIHMIVYETIAAGIIAEYWITHAFMALMAVYPKIQKKLQEEVDTIIGSREPRLSDRQQMPYLEATVLEVLRFISPDPMLIPHMATEDSTIQDYLITKGSEIWVNVYNLHHDERYWKEPCEFKPERFLEVDGQLVSPTHPNRKRLLAFGAGRRVCPGEALAKNRLFLLFTSFMQAFSFSPAEGEEPPVVDTKKRLPGLVSRLPPYKIVAHTRI